MLHAFILKAVPCFITRLHFINALKTNIPWYMYSVHFSALQGLPFELNRKVFSDDLNVSTLWIFIISFLLIQVPVTMFAWRVVHISLLQVLFGFRRFQFVLIESTSSYDWQVGWVHDVSDTLILYHTIVVILLLKYWWDVSKMNWMIGIINIWYNCI